MTDIEQKARALVNEVRADRGFGLITWFDREEDIDDIDREALCRAIEQHEAFRQEVSEAVKAAIEGCGHDGLRAAHIRRFLSRFIIQPKTDPLVEAVKDAANPDYDAASPEAYAEILRAALAKRGLVIREINNDRP